MAGGNTDAATKEMETLHVGHTQETKVSTIKAEKSFSLPSIEPWKFFLALSSWLLQHSLYLCWYVEKCCG